MAKDQKTLLAILAVCAASTVDAVEKRRGATDHALDATHAQQLAEGLKLDMAEYWQPTAEGYFGRVSKDQTLGAIEEVGGLSKKSGCSSLKKDALAKAAEKELKGKRWLRLRRSRPAPAYQTRSRIRAVAFWRAAAKPRREEAARF
jgi:ParB family chromosome partitioning protein